MATNPDWTYRMVDSITERMDVAWSSGDREWLARQLASGQMDAARLRQIGARDAVRDVMGREETGWSDADQQWARNRLASGRIDGDRLYDIASRDADNLAAGTPGGKLPDWTLRMVDSVMAREQPGWNGGRREELARGLAAGTITKEQLQQMGLADGQTVQNNKNMIGNIARGLGLPQEFIGMFVDAYIESGSQDVNAALGEVRNSPQYDEYFPGNKLGDGRIRHNESQYLAIRDSYIDSLEQFGLNPDVYAGNFGGLIGGDVSPDEFMGRLDSLNRRIVQAPQEVRDAFANEFGISAMSDPASILGVAVDPSIGEQVRERRMDISVVTGQAQRFGFRRNRQRVETLLNSGMSADAAQQFYGQAQPTTYRLGRSGGQTGEQFGITDLENASILNDTDALRSAARLDRQEASRFSQAADVQRGQSGELIGLDWRA